LHIDCRKVLDSYLPQFFLGFIANRLQQVLYTYTTHLASTIHTPYLNHMADLYSSTNTNGVFVYTEGAAVPLDVVRARVHPSVTIIPEDDILPMPKNEIC